MLPTEANFPLATLTTDASEYSRVGSVLWLVCLSLPRPSVDFIRSQDPLQYNVIQEWNGSVDPEKVTRVIRHACW